MSFPFEIYVEEARAKGRSEEFITLTSNYARKLDDQQLPVIFSLQHFGSLVGIPSRVISKIIEYRNNQYVQFYIRKRDGGRRQIMTPEKKLLYLQKWINRNILQNIPVMDCCTGFAPGTSLATNGYIHRNSKKILKVDLARFFDTITDKRVYGFFKYLGYHPNVAYDLACLTTARPSFEAWNSMEKEEILSVGSKIHFETGVLPQGAATSPQLANCIANSLDIRLSKLALKYDCRYSRYADDLVFSTPSDNGKLPSLDLITKIIENEGFFVNNKKTAYLKHGMKQYVTGLTVTHGFHVSKIERQEIFKHLYYARKYGPYEHLKKWSKDNDMKNEFPYGFKEWLLGKISFVYSIDHKVGKKMLEQYNAIIWGF